MIYTRSAVAAISLAAALAACTSTEPDARGTAETHAGAAANANENAPRLGSASAALQTGVSTAAITGAPQRPAPTPPPAATGPSIAAAHAAPAAPPAPVIPEPAPAAAPAVAAAPAAPAQPAAPAAASAAAPAAAPQQAGLTAAQLGEARQLFNSFSCGVCHVLADAEGSGHIGPALDGNRALTREFVIEIVDKGRGAMPGFGGQMSAEEIALLASYIIEVRK